MSSIPIRKSENRALAFVSLNVPVMTKFEYPMMGLSKVKGP